MRAGLDCRAAAAAAAAAAADDKEAGRALPSQHLLDGLLISDSTKPREPESPTNRNMGALGPSAVPELL